MRKRVALVDDHRFFAELLALAIRGEADFEVVGRAHDATDARAMVEKLRPDLVIMDVRLGEDDGIDLTAELTATHPGLLVVILTAYAEGDLMTRASAARACALLPKDGNLPSLLSALRKVDGDGFMVDPSLLHRMIGRAQVHQQVHSLTPREAEVLRLMADGLDARLISRQIGISLHTTRGHVKSILSKLEVHSQLEAVAKAMRQGLIGVQPSN